MTFSFANDYNANDYNANAYNANAYNASVYNVKEGLPYFQIPYGIVKPPWQQAMNG